VNEDRVCHIADLERDIDTHFLIHPNLDAIDRGRLEAGRLHIDGVHAGREQRRCVLPVFIGRHDARQSGGRLGEGHTRAGDDRAGRVADRPADRAGDGLCRSQRGKSSNDHDHEDEATQGPHGEDASRCPERHATVKSDCRVYGTRAAGQ
jgi:hypothetical protein